MIGKCIQSLNGKIIVILLLISNIGNASLAIGCNQTQTRLFEEDLSINCQEVEIEKFGSIDDNYGLLNDFELYQLESKEYALVTTQSEGLLLFDVTDKGNVIFTKQLFENRSLTDIIVQQNYILLSEGNREIFVYNFEDITNPILVSSYNESNDFRELLFEDEVLYIDYIHYMSFVNFSDPVNPSKMGYYNYSSSVNEFQLGSNFLVLVRYNKLSFVNISDFSNPKLITEYNNDTYGFGIYENYLFFTPISNYLTIYDISNLTNPIELGEIPGISWFGEFINETIMIYYRAGNISLIDWSNPYNATISAVIPNIQPQGTYYLSYDLIIRPNGNNLFVFRNHGFTIYNLEDIANPVLMYHFKQTGYACDIELVNNIAFIANGYGGLQIINCSDVNNPQLLSTFYTNDFCIQVCVYDDIAYLMSYEHLVIVNITDLTKPNEISCKRYWINWQYQAQELVAQNNRLYLTRYFRGCLGEISIYVTIFNITNRIDLEIIGGYSDYGLGDNWYPDHDFARNCRNAIGMQIIGNKLYFANGHYDLCILDISDESNIKKIGAYHGVDVHASSIWVENEIVFLGDARQGLHMLDISIMNNITLLDTVFTNDPLEVPWYYSGVQSLQYSNGYLYAADYSDGLLVFEILENNKLQQVGCFFDGGRASDVLVAGNIALVADYNDGLELLHINGLPIEKPFKGNNTMKINIVLPFIVLMVTISIIYQFKKRKVIIE